MIRILFLPAYFIPEHAASSYLGNNRYERFASEGMEMVVYCPTPTRGISHHVRQRYKTKKEEWMYGNKLYVHRFALFGEGKGAVMRALRYLLQAIMQFCYGVFGKDARRCNVMFISSTPPIQGAMAALIKKIRGIPFIYNLQDIFPDSLVGTGMTKQGSLLWKIGRAIENFTYRNADKIIVISQDFKRNIMDKGVPEEKIEVIYNWVDENAVVNIPRAENKLFDHYNLDREKFYITYCGNIGLTQNMDMLLSIANELQTYPDIHFVLVGEGAYKQQVESIIRNKSIQNVTILPFQPYEDISYVFSLGDVGLIISKPGVGENSLPSKTWSIMSAERAVVANFDRNELESIINNNQCGIFTEAGDRESFKQALLALYRDRAQCKKMGENGRQFILNNLTKEIGTRKCVGVVRGFENK